jgi:hypothetical protein
MSPFHDLGQLCGGPLPAAGAPSVSFSGPVPAAGRLPDAYDEPPVISLSRFASLLALGVVGLVGLLSLGVGGVALVQDYAFPAAKGTTEVSGAVRNPESSPSRAAARRGSGASPSAMAGESSARVFGEGSLRQRWAARLGAAPRRPVSISRNQPAMLAIARLEMATRPSAE